MVMRKRRMLMVLLVVSGLIGSAWAIDNKGITFEQPAADCFTLIETVRLLQYCWMKKMTSGLSLL